METTVIVLIYVGGVPRPQGSKRAFVRGKQAMLVEASPYAREWRSHVAAMVDSEAGGRKCDHYSLAVRVIRARPKAHYNSKGQVKPQYVDIPCCGTPDLDKVVRNINDAIVLAGFCKDDSRNTRQTAERVWGEDHGCEIRIEGKSRPGLTDDEH